MVLRLALVAKRWCTTSKTEIESVIYAAREGRFTCILGNLVRNAGPEIPSIPIPSIPTPSVEVRLLSNKQHQPEKGDCILGKL